MSYADLDGSGTIESGSEILEEKNYYPFGLQHDGYNMGVKPQRSVEAEQYTFLDKEFEDSFDLNVTETDFRHYDSALGRFNVMDPLAELAYDFTPYRYGFNNPVFFGDASGLFESWGDAYAYKKANKLDGSSIEYDSDANLFKIIDGDVTITQVGNMINKMYMIGDDMHLSQTRAGGGGSSNGGNNGVNPNAIPCVSCHHTTTFNNGVKTDPYGVMLYGDEATDFKAPWTKRNVDSFNIQPLMDLADIFSPDVSKRLENAFELQKYIEKNSLNSKNINTKIKYSLPNFGIYQKGGYSSFVEVRSYHERDTFVNQKDVSTLNLFREMDSLKKIPQATKYNDSVNSSIINRFKK